MRISDGSSTFALPICVDRRHRLLVRPVGAAVAPLGLAFLYASGVRQHVIKQVAGGGGAPYRAAIALGHKLGQQPAVIDMGVAEDDGGQSRRIEGKGFPVERFKRPRTLEEPTVDQHRKIAVSQLHAGYRESTRLNSSH